MAWNEVDGEPTPPSIPPEVIPERTGFQTGGRAYIGPQGPRGPKGDRGDLGPQGPKGDTGDKGDTGLVGPTGPQGLQGAQGAKGDTGARGITGLTGPQGSEGPMGPTGPQGEQGIEGPEGAQGDRGTEGPQGTKGDTGLTGAQGPKGDTGNTGAQGVKGEQGDRGIQGLVGADGPIGPQGTTGPTGAQGAKGDTGNTGPTGPQGTTGATGLQGAQGIKGDTGTQGPIGLTGAKGDPGTQGVQGIQGVTGAKGDTGNTGPQGATGLQGLIGPQGVAGPTGAKGDTGLTGPKGNDGAGIEIAGQVPTYASLPTNLGPANSGSGYYVEADGLLYIWSGTAFPANGAGTQFRGATGLQGPVGPVGPKGDIGNTGATGATGTQGPTGATGATGTQGPKGDIGTTGAQGPQGIQGVTGTAGRGFNPRGAWVASTTYAVDDIYTRSGNTYRVTTAHTSPATWVITNAELWATAGTNGTGFNPRGAWAASTVYAVNDIVTYAGSTYRVSTAHTSTTTFAPANFQVWAAQGAQGIQGPTGTAGTAGTAGATGPVGPAGAQGIQGIQGATGIKFDTDGQPYISQDTQTGLMIPVGLRIPTNRKAKSEIYNPAFISSVVFNDTAPAFVGQKQVIWQDALANTQMTARGGLLTPQPSVPAVAVNLVNGSTATYTAWDAAVMLTGKSIAAHLYFTDFADVILYVDGYPVAQQTTVTPGVNSQFLSLTFTEYGEREVALSLGRSSGLVQWLIPGDANIMAPPEQERWAWISDSYGTGQYGTVDVPGNMFTGAVPHWFKKAMGIDLYNQAQGGTGYMNDAGGVEGHSVYGSSSRRAALAALPSNLKVIIVFGGGNDAQAKYTSAAITAAAAQMYANIAIDRPGVPVIVVGTEPGLLTGAIDPIENDRANAAIKVAALAAPNVKSFIDMRAATYLITGTGRQGAPAYDGNADIYISNDRIHPTQVGAKHIGLWLADQIRKVVL